MMIENKIHDIALASHKKLTREEILWRLRKLKKKLVDHQKQVNEIFKMLYTQPKREFL